MYLCVSVYMCICVYVYTCVCKYVSMHAYSPRPVGLVATHRKRNGNNYRANWNNDWRQYTFSYAAKGPPAALQLGHQILPEKTFLPRGVN